MMSWKDPNSGVSSTSSPFTVLSCNHSGATSIGGSFSESWVDCSSTSVSVDAKGSEWSKIQQQASDQSSSGLELQFPKIGVQEDPLHSSVASTVRDPPSFARIPFDSSKSLTDGVPQPDSNGLSHLRRFDSAPFFTAHSPSETSTEPGSGLAPATVEAPLFSSAQDATQSSTNSPPSLVFAGSDSLRDSTSGKASHDTLNSVEALSGSTPLKFSRIPYYPQPRASPWTSEIRGTGIAPSNPAAAAPRVFQKGSSTGGPSLSGKCSSGRLHFKDNGLYLGEPIETKFPPKNWCVFLCDDNSYELKFSRRYEPKPTLFTPEVPGAIEIPKPKEIPFQLPVPKFNFVSEAQKKCGCQQCNKRVDALENSQQSQKQNSINRYPLQAQRTAEEWAEINRLHTEQRKRKDDERFIATNLAIMSNSDLDHFQKTTAIAKYKKHMEESREKLDRVNREWRQRIIDPNPNPFPSRTFQTLQTSSSFDQSEEKRLPKNRARILDEIPSDSHLVHRAGRNFTKTRGRILDEIPSDSGESGGNFYRQRSILKKPKEADILGSRPLDINFNDTVKHDGKKVDFADAKKVFVFKKSWPPGLAFKHAYVQPMVPESDWKPPMGPRGFSEAREHLKNIKALLITKGSFTTRESI